jgi:hypothetical protein
MKLRFLIKCAVVFIFCGQLFAQTDSHTFNNPNTSAVVDDDGGFTGRFRFILNGVDQFGEGGIMIWDGNESVDPWNQNDFGGTGSGVFVEPANGNYGLADQVTVGDVFNDTPVFFSGGNVGVSQRTYTQDSGNYVVYHWLVTNEGNVDIDVPKLMFLADWDLDDSEDDVLSGFDVGRNLAFQQDGPANFDNSYTTGGIGLLDGVFDNFHLGNCCDFRDDVNGAHARYFAGTAGTGDVDSGDPDKQVGVSAELPLLAPGETACVAFVELMAQGTSSVDATLKLQIEYDNALALWQSIPNKGSCFNINSGVNDAWFNPATNGQGFFVTVFPTIGQMFVAWFTYDTERPGAGVTANLGEPGHRWLTAFGPVTGNKAVLDIEVTSGGVFDMAEPMPTQETDGTLTVEFSGCNEGMMSYDIPSLSLVGDIPIQRIALDNADECQAMQGNVTAQ